MLVKMRPGASAGEVRAIEDRLADLGFKTGIMIGEEITLIGIYGDISRLPSGEIEQMAGVEVLIPISKAYKRVAQKGSPGHLVHQRVAIASVMCGGPDLAVIGGPCSVESEAQIMEAARIVKAAGCNALRGGVVKYRSSPYSGWEGLGAEDERSLRKALDFIVKAGRAYELPTVVEILDPGDLPLYEDTGIDCLQIGEPNSKNQALLNRLRTTPLPVIHKRGNSLDTEAYLLWVERVLSLGKENVILCERGITTCNRYTRNTLDLGSVAAFHYQLSGLPIAVDASHGTGIRDLVHPMTLAGIMAGASVVLVEAHPNPLIAKSDGFQSLFAEQLKALVQACRQVYGLRLELDRTYVSSASIEEGYNAKLAADRQRLFGSQ
jgi:3-deoxy-7-phosphoheptulonate synthase